jgi:hypothetical protein
MELARNEVTDIFGDLLNTLPFVSTIPHPFPQYRSHPSPGLPARHRDTLDHYLSGPNHAAFALLPFDDDGVAGL